MIQNAILYKGMLSAILHKVEKMVHFGIRKLEMVTNFVEMSAQSQDEGDDDPASRRVGLKAFQILNTWPFSEA
jgi:hypothetical protein